MRVPGCASGVPVERQKVMAKGVWKGTLKDDADMSSFTFKPKQKVCSRDCLWPRRDVMVADSAARRMSQVMLMGKAAEIPTGENRPDVVRAPGPHALAARG